MNEDTFGGIILGALLTLLLVASHCSLYDVGREHAKIDCPEDTVITWNARTNQHDICIAVDDYKPER